MTSTVQGCSVLFIIQEGCFSYVISAGIENVFVKPDEQ